jgi:hypothetical protein
MIVSSDAPEAQQPPEAPETPPGVPAPAEPVEAASPPAPEPSDEDDTPETLSPREARRLAGRMTAQRTAMERELGAAKAELGAMKAQVDTLMKLIQPAQQEPEDGRTGPPRRPRMSEYVSEEAYEAAQEAYERDLVDARLAERETQGRQQAMAAAQAQNYAEKMQAIQVREQELLKTVPDYYERFQFVGPQLAEHVLDALKLTGGHGPDLVLYLADHPEEIPRLNQTPYQELGVELGMLRSPQAARTPPATSTNAPSSAPRLPEPPQPVSGNGATVTPGYRDDWPQEQFDAWTRRMHPQMPYQQRR